MFAQDEQLFKPHLFIVQDDELFHRSTRTEPPSRNRHGDRHFVKMGKPIGLWQ